MKTFWCGLKKKCGRAKKGILHTRARVGPGPRTRAKTPGYLGQGPGPAQALDWAAQALLHTTCQGEGWRMVCIELVNQPMSTEQRKKHGRMQDRSLILFKKIHSKIPFDLYLAYFRMYSKAF